MDNFLNKSGSIDFILTVDFYIMNWLLIYILTFKQPQRRWVAVSNCKIKIIVRILETTSHSYWKLPQVFCYSGCTFSLWHLRRSIGQKCCKYINIKQLNFEDGDVHEWHADFFNFQFGSFDLSLNIAYFFNNRTPFVCKWHFKLRNFLHKEKQTLTIIIMSGLLILYLLFRLDAKLSSFN